MGRIIPYIMGKMFQTTNQLKNHWFTIAPMTQTRTLSSLLDSGLSPLSCRDCCVSLVKSMRAEPGSGRHLHPPKTIHLTPPNKRGREGGERGREAGERGARERGERGQEGREGGERGARGGREEGERGARGGREERGKRGARGQSLL